MLKIKKIITALCFGLTAANATVAEGWPHSWQQLTTANNLSGDKSRLTIISQRTVSSVMKGFLLLKLRIDRHSQKLSPLFSGLPGWQVTILICYKIGCLEKKKGNNFFVERTMKWQILQRALRSLFMRMVGFLFHVGAWIQTLKVSHRCYNVLRFPCSDSVDSSNHENNMGSEQHL